MKKILTAAIALAVSMSAFAQSNFSIGIGETLRHRMGTNEMATNALTSAQSGLMIEATYGYDFSDYVGLTAGARFSFEGIYNKKVVDLKILGVKMQSKWLNNFLEVPVNVKFHVNPGSAVDFFVAAGPTFSFWAGSTIKTYTEVVSPDGNVNVNKSNLFEKDNNYFNRCNIGAGLTLGLDIIDHIRVTLGYDYYFLDQISKGTTGAGTLKNGCGRLGVAYIF